MTILIEPEVTIPALPETYQETHRQKGI